MKHDRKPAFLGGAPAFPDGLRLARPFLPPAERVAQRLAGSFDSGVLTNGPLVRELEARAAERLGVDHVVAVSSCTAGLMLTLRALALSRPIERVALPSFTFSASAHAVRWNGMAPVFAECDPSHLQVDVADVTRRAEQTGAQAVMATHVFGAPAPVEDLERWAADRGAALVFDAAHGFGGLRRGRALGSFGDAEVFSLSPTKVLVAGEGGLVATRHAELAEQLRIGRDYANPGDYDTRWVGLNARMSEAHAATALESLELLDEHLARRRHLADLYRKLLGEVPGIEPQHVDAADSSTYKDFTVVVDEVELGISRDVLVRALSAEGVETRKYFDPPVHRQRSYAGEAPTTLPVTDRASSSVVSLPMYGALEPAAVERLIEVIGDLHATAESVRSAA